MKLCRRRVASFVSKRRAWAIVRAALAALLLSTAALKFWFTRDYLGSSGPLSQPWLLATAAGIEVGAALVILTAPARFGFLIAALVFGSFAVISGWSFATGRDCGCFGPQTSATWPLIVDMCSLVVLAMVRPRIRYASAPTTLWRSMGLSAASSAAAVIGMFAVVSHSLANHRGIPVFFDDNLVGHQWPLIARDDYPFASNRFGKSLVIFLRPDCEHCREFALEWKKSPLPGWDDSQVTGIAVENEKWTVMPRVISADPVDLDGSAILEWESGTEPFVATPAVFVLEDQRVSCALDGDSALEVLRVGAQANSLCKHEKP